MKYKGYVGSAKFSAEDGIFHGRIQGIRDLVTYEGTDVASLERSFRESVDGYDAVRSSSLVNPGRMSPPRALFPEMQARLEAMAADLRRRIKSHEIAAERVAEWQEQSAIYSRNEQSALQIEHDRRQLAAVLDALRRIADGSYGECLRCAEPIAEKRLAAVLFAPHCKDCAEVIEAEERLESEMVAYREVE